MKPWHVMTALILLLGTGWAGAAPGPDELVMSRTAQVLGDVGGGRYQLEVTVTLEAGANVAAGLTALAVEETLPTGWVYESIDVTPAVSTVNSVPPNTYQFVWVTLPDLSTPFSFKYYVNYPSSSSGASIVGKAPYRTGGGPLESATVTTPQNAISCLKMSRTVAGYNPGQQVTVQVTVESLCGEPVTALAVEETWPAGWSFVSSTGVGTAGQSLAPPVGAEGTLQFIWFSPIPSFPFTFSYTVLAPVTASGQVSMQGQSVARLSGPELRTPLVVSLLDRLDTTPPVVTINGTSPVTVECGGTYTDAGATATDSVDGSVAVTTDNPVNPAVVNTYTVTYTARDSAGNPGTATRTVNVVDRTAPTLTLNGAALVTVECRGAYTEPGATATDVCAGVLTSAISITGTVNTNIPADYTRTYTVLDPSNNIATATRTVRVVDTAAPVITLNGAASVTVTCGQNYVEQGATATDACGGNLSSSILVTGTVNTGVPGTYQRTYAVSDTAGNAATPVVRTVTVSDTTAPVITLNGAATVTVACGQIYNELSASALDSCAGDLSASVSVTGTVNTLVPGTYTRTYTVSDPSGNAASPVTRTVNVTDTVAPVIALNGAASVTVECGGTYTDAGAAALDACDGNVSRYLTVTGTVDASAPGVYTLTYNAHDSSNNTAVPVTRTVTVSDTTAPVISVSGANPLTLDCGGTYTDAGASATDRCDATVTVAADVPEINTNYPATYTVTYTASDGAGNTSTATRSVVVGGPNCDFCPMTDVVVLHPSGKTLIPSTLAQAYIGISSEVLFAHSDDCLEGTVSMSYTVDGIEYVPTADRVNNFPIVLLLGPGEHALHAEATLVETGQVISTDTVFSVVQVNVSENGYPFDPFTTVTPDGTTFSNIIHRNGYNRSIEMVSALCPEDGGGSEDITVTANFGEPSRTLTVTVPRAAIPCGYAALVTVTVSDTVEGLMGTAESGYLNPVPEGLISGGLFFDVSILVASLTDVAAGEPVAYTEIDNAIIAEHPVDISLNGLTFSPNLIPVFLSHATSFGADSAADMNLFGDTAGWSEDHTMNFMAEGDTLHGQATSLSVFAPFEKEKVLTFTPDIEYGVIFGRAVINTHIDKVFTVRNNGGIRAHGAASIEDTSGVFTIVGDAAYDLAPGESYELTVRFSPTESKDYEGILNFSGDPNTDLSVRLLGTGTAGPRKKCLAFLSCSQGAGGASGGDAAALAAALGLIGAGAVRARRRRS